MGVYSLTFITSKYPWFLRWKYNVIVWLSIVIHVVKSSKLVINMIGATSGAGTAYPSVGPEFSLVFSGVHVAQ
jgi:hypothetical protein